MPTVGSVDVNLDNVKDIVNNTTETGAAVTGGVADMGDLIGVGIGLGVAFVAIGFGVGVILSVLGIVIFWLYGMIARKK